MNAITEIVTMTNAQGIERDAFIRIVDDLELNFHAKQPGYIDTELLYDEKTGEWIMIQHWDTLDNMMNASKQMFKESCTEVFRKAIDPKTITLRNYEQVQNWKPKL